MLEIGRQYEMVVTSINQRGAYLKSELEPEEREILLPGIQLPEDTKVGDKLEVFLYRDSKDRKIATLKVPKIMLGQLAPLKVVSINRIGAFLDWGLERDLFLPFNEQVQDVHKGEVHLVGMYIDKSDRLCATMKIYSQLQGTDQYDVNDEVSGTVYSIKPAFGAFVAVDNKYHGLVPTKELYGECKLGETLNFRVRKVREDGKLELSLRKTTHLQMEDDAKKIMAALEVNNGFLDLHDKSSPEEIKHRLHMSKAAYKRAIGRLMKEGVLEIKENGIKRNW